MINIRANENRIIEVVSIEELYNTTCTVDELPSDFYEKLNDGKYLANKDGIYINPSYTEQYDLIRKNLIQKALDELNYSLENEFSWADKIVKLSESNQKDYAAAFGLACVCPNETIPMTYTFKNNIKHQMTTLDEIKQFTLMAFAFVSAKLEVYRTRVDEINNMTNQELENEEI